MDIIFIHELRLETVIGVYPEERQAMRTLLLDLELGVDSRPVALSDSLDDTLDYQAVAQRVIELAAASEIQLVETLAERIAGQVLQEFPVPWLRLTLRKPGVPSGAREAGIRIERRRPE